MPDPCPAQCSALPIAHQPEHPFSHPTTACSFLPQPAGTSIFDVMDEFPCDEA